MYFRTVIVFLIFCFFASFLKAEDPALKAVTEVLSARENFSGQAYTNPSMQPFFRKYSLSQLEIGGETENNPFHLQQEGSGGRQLAFYANSHLHLSDKDHVWGNASYKNGIRKDIQWCENSDYYKIYPYVMADSIGGDLFSEEYAFTGGYARTGHRFSWGAAFSYRALMEYRNIDPRPKNTTSDLSLKAGASYEVFPGYFFGGCGLLNLYDQRSEVAFYNESGTYPVFHLLGFDRSLIRFNYDENSIDYTGKSYGASLDLVPRDKSGFFFSLSYNRFSLEKIIPYKSSGRLSIATIEEPGIDFELAYLKKSPAHTWGVKIEGFSRNRLGNEGIPDNQTDNVSIFRYVQQFSHTVQLAGISGIYCMNRGAASFSVSPRISTNRMTMEYKDPFRKMDLLQYSGGLNIGLIRTTQRFLFHLALDASYTINPESELNLSAYQDGGTLLLMRETVRQNYHYLSTDNLQSFLSFRCDYFLPRNNMGVFFKADYSQMVYFPDTSGFRYGNGIKISLGITL